MSLNLTAYLNERFQFTYDVDAFASVYSNLATAAWVFQIRPNEGSPVVNLDFRTGGSPQSAAAVVVFLPGTPDVRPAQIVVRCPASLLIAVSAGTYSVDFGFILPGADFERVDGGSIEFKTGVTILPAAGTPGPPTGADDTVLGGANAAPSPFPITLGAAIGAAQASAIEADAAAAGVAASASAATDAKTAAQGFATSAAASASAAGVSVTAAAGSASTATGAATSATGSATAAAGSATAAAASASDAAASATAAADAAAAASGSGSTAAAVVAAGTFMEKLTVTAADTLSAASHTPTATFAVLWVNGQAFFSLGGSPAFSFSGTTFTWHAANAGVHLATTDSVVVLYSR
jgi:hypothetical protein